MNIAAILAMLLSSGACAKSDFHGSDGGILQVVVCPMTMPPAPPAAPEPPPALAVPERRS